MIDKIFEVLFGKPRPRQPAALRRPAPPVDGDAAEAARRKLMGVLGEREAAELQRLIQDERAKPPRVAILGKSGVGKTSTINNVFNATWMTSHTIAGTTQAQCKEFDLHGGGKLTVVDMPGLGEDVDADAAYERIYREELPQVDVALLVMQANARDLAEDQRILEEVVLPALGDAPGKLVIGLNQVDKIGPGAWDAKLNHPSPEQQRSIALRCRDIAAKLSAVTAVRPERIVYYSATQRYRLYDLLIALIKAAENLGWKLPIQPRDPFELADPEVQEFVRQARARRGR